MAQTGQSEAIHSPRGVRQHGREIDDAGGLVDRRGLHRRDFVLAQGLAHDVKPARQRGIPEGSVGRPRTI
jgi:hypothetical protein